MFKSIILNILRKKPAVTEAALPVREPAAAAAEGVPAALPKVFRRSVRIRQVDAGSCNACEWECTALTNPVYDVQRFGLDFVASPRHADVLLVTGPVSLCMAEALKKTYDATPAPKIVITCGDCANDGGVYRGSYAVMDGVQGVVPVDGHIPGCPPTPSEIMTGIRDILDRFTSGRA